MISAEKQRNIQYIKEHLYSVIQDIFVNNKNINAYINDNLLTKEEAILIIKEIDTYNTLKCLCCRQFNFQKINISILPKNLEPLLKIVAKTVLNKRQANATIKF